MSIVRNAKERERIIAALWRWIDSQEIEHAPAALVLVQLAGFFAGQHAAEHGKDLDAGLDMLCKIMRNTAKVGLSIKVDYD